MSDTLDKIVPEAGPNGEALYRHDAEGTFLSYFNPGWISKPGVADAEDRA